MPRFNANITFDLVTEIEPEFYSGRLVDEGVEGVIESEDSSYWQREEVRCSGGDVNVVIEAESEEAAEEIAAQVVSDGSDMEDANGFGWTIENVSIEVEVIEEPMTRDRAKTILSLWLSDADIPEDVREAFRFLLTEIV